MYMDPQDPIQIPQTFPIQDIGEITPGTTDIDEPPPGFPPPPQQTQSRTPTRSAPTVSASDTESEGHAPSFSGWVKAQHMLRAMGQHLEFVTEQQGKLQQYVYDSIAESEKVVPLQLVYVKRDDGDEAQITDYYYAQDRSSKKWAMVTWTREGHSSSSKAADHA